jgi:hypothetical protein
MVIVLVVVVVVCAMDATREQYRELFCIYANVNVVFEQCD